ncbi:MAG: flavin reductase family protein [Micromonosporaceae bacterium]
MDTQSRVSGDVTDTARLRRVLGSFATGVTVVTVGGARPHGMTANSFTSVSLTPPLILVCVGREAVMHESLVESGAFAVSVLAGSQESIARHFADRRRPLGKEQFDVVDWLPGPHTGAPLIAGALAHFECEVRRSYDGGDHTIFVGNLLSLDLGERDDALVVVHGSFLKLATA